MIPQETRDNLVLYACFWEATIPVLIWLYTLPKLVYFSDIPILIMVGAFCASVFVTVDGIRNYIQYKKMIKNRL